MFSLYEITYLIGGEMKRLLKICALLLTLIMALTACGGKKTDKATDVSKKGGTDVKRLSKVENDGDAIKGGILKVAVVSDSPFVGVFSREFYQDNYDSKIMQDTIWGSYLEGEDLELKSSDAVDIDFSEEDKTVTIKVKDGFKWSNGTPVTSKDYEFHYKVIGHPEYTGVRYDSYYKDIVGMEDYHTGKTEEISGITLPDEKTIEIKFNTFKPSILWGAGLPFDPMPYEYLKDISIKDMESSPEIRENPLSVGPFVISKVVPGERVEFVRNENYWGGEVKLDGIEMEIVPESNVLSALKSGKYDTVTSIPASIKLEDLEDLDNYSILERDELSYSYLGFKLGTWDKDKEEVKVDPKAKMADPNLRKAMGYALDNNAIGKEFYEGLRRQANGVIVPVFKSFYDENQEGFKYDPEKAKKLLDEAGYKDKDGDGFREDPNGEKLVIKLAAMSGGEVAEPLAQAYIQWWKDIGLNVELTNGRLIEFQAFYDMVDADDKNIDVFMAGWGVASYPDPAGVYSKTAKFNRYRYTDEKIEKALNDIGSEKAFDTEFSKQAYKEFNDALFEAAPVIPTMFRNELKVVNNRVKKFDWTWASNFSWSEIELTADKPIK